MTKQELVENARAVRELDAEIEEKKGQLKTLKDSRE